MSYAKLVSELGSTFARRSNVTRARGRPSPDVDDTRRLHDRTPQVIDLLDVDA
jgi:hypothetical protein